VTRSNEAEALEEMGLPPPEDFGGVSNQPRRDEARMRTNSRRGGAGLGLAVLTLVVSLPDSAQAQQSGLFPLAPIRRQRIPCEMQDPIYQKIKEQYYGFHPTCWRRFPDGWGCPSPERPDREKSYRDLPPHTGDEDLMPERETPETERPMRPDGTRPAIPTIPERGPSPFETLPNTPSDTPAVPRGGQRPPSLPPGGDPFQLDRTNPPGAARPGPGAARMRPAPTPAVNNGPELSAPDETTGRIPAGRTSRNDAEEATDGRGDDGPLLALPNVNLPSLYDPASFGSEPAQATADSNTAANGSAGYGSTAPRRGFLSGMFNNLGLNWTRR
jgi:hypothetical protein